MHEKFKYVVTAENTHSQGRHESTVTLSRVTTKQFAEREGYAKFTGGIKGNAIYFNHT